MALPPDRSDADRPVFRWSALFQAAAEPVFVFNRRGRLLFANRAWEEAAGLALAEARGRPRSRRAPSDETDAARDALVRALAPPADARAGRSCHACRRLPGAAWWEIDYVPLADAQGVLAIIGRARVLGSAEQPSAVLPERLRALRDRQADRYRLDDLGDSTPALRRVQEQARLAGASSVPLLLRGAPGSGKEWLARTLHQRGPDRQHAFVRLDCPRLPLHVLEELLFGPRSPVRTAGTLYLREPAALPRELQRRLVERLDIGPPAPRLMAGLRGDPQDEVRAGRLLDEFAYRMSTLTITLPPLRERGVEMPRLIETLRERARQATGQPARRVSDEALQVLFAHAWPGNLRELYTVLRGACRHAKGEQIELADLPFYLRHGPVPAERTLPLNALLERAEQRLIELALRLTGNNQTRAAEFLEVWRPWLNRRMKHFGLLPPGASAEGDAAKEE